MCGKVEDGMKIRIKKTEIPKGRRILVTSDIHGHKTLLQRLLGKVGFCGEDMLFIIGDLIEKGPESLETLRYVMGLAEMDNVVVLLGNVDLWRVQMLEELSEENSEDFYSYLLKMRQWCGASIFDQMGAELGISLDSPKKALACKNVFLECFRGELDFIRALPAIVETRDYIFVHAGLPCTELEEVKERDIYEVLKLDNFMASGLSFEKYVIVGHWPVSIYNNRIMQTNPIIDQGHHIISIDGGCGLHMEGQLNMLMLPWAGCSTREITYTFCDDFERFKALSFQEGSKDSVNISYTDRKVRILEEGEEFSCVEHLSSGRRIRIVNERLYNRNGEWADVNYSDYLLPVKEGDVLAMVMKTSEGCFMKKDGVCGWYRGELGPLSGCAKKEEEKIFHIS